MEMNNFDMQRVMAAFIRLLEEQEEVQIEYTLTKKDSEDGTA